MIDLKEDTWIQVAGDADPGRFGGLFAQRDGEAIRVFSVEPVRDLMGLKGAREEGYPFWKSEGFYTPQDLLYGDDAQEVLKDQMEVVSEANWDQMPDFERAARLFERGVGKEAAGGGWAKDVLPGEEEVTSSLEEEGIQVLTEEEDGFNQDVLGVVEVWLCTLRNAAGKVLNGRGFLVTERGEVLEWTREMVQEDFEDEDREPDFDFWRSDPYNVPLVGGGRVVCELVHTFKSDNLSSNEEAAELYVEAFNDGIKRYFEEDLSDEVRQLLEEAPELTC